MTPAELAEWLRIPLDTLYRWRTHGLGPKGHRMGRHVRYRRRDVEVWIEQQADERQPA